MSRAFRYYLRVRYIECDAQKVVFNSRYSEYVDVSINEFLRAAGVLHDFAEGHLDFQPGLPVRLARVGEQCPLVIDVALDRPAILTPLLSLASALTVSFGSSGAAWLDAVTGRVPPRGRLPLDLPRSMAQVREHPEDVPGFGDPLFPRGWGLQF